MSDPHKAAVVFHDDEIEQSVRLLAAKIFERAVENSKSGHSGELLLNVNIFTLQVVELLCNLTINAQATAILGESRDAIQERQDRTVEGLK